MSPPANKDAFQVLIQSTDGTGRSHRSQSLFWLYDLFDAEPVNHLQHMRS
jgi:hypothetical protein